MVLVDSDGSNFQRRAVSREIRSKYRPPEGEASSAYATRPVESTWTRTATRTSPRMVARYDTGTSGCARSVATASLALDLRDRAGAGGGRISPVFCSTGALATDAGTGDGTGVGGTGAGLGASAEV